LENQDKLGALIVWIAKLDQTIADKEARDYFLGHAKNWLGDVERRVPGAEFILPLIEQQLTRAQDAVSKYGPNVRIIG
jgi:hypothetical protein